MASASGSAQIQAFNVHSVRSGAAAKNQIRGSNSIYQSALMAVTIPGCTLFPRLRQKLKNLKTLLNLQLHRPGKHTGLNLPFDTALQHVFCRESSHGHLAVPADKRQNHPAVQSPALIPACLQVSP